jgi:hypothetical protein
MKAYVLRDDFSKFSGPDETYTGVKTYLESKEALRMNHSDLERELAVQGKELLRQLLQAHLDLRGPGEAVGEVSDQEGTVHGQARPHSRELETLFGTVIVNRLGYATPGTESLHPKDAALNLPEDRYSMGVRRRIAEEAARGSFEEAAEEVERTTGAHIPKRQAEELAVRSAQDFEDFYRVRRETALVKDPAGKILALSFDGKGVVMRKEDLREATRKAAEENSHKLQTRLCRGEKRNAKRMATVGAIYTVAPFQRAPEDVIRVLAGKDPPGPEPLKPDRPRPEDKRVMASLERTPEEVIAELFADAQHRDPKRAKTWVALVDGNPTQIRLIAAEARRQKIHVTTIVDFIHVTEYVWKAGTAFFKAGSKELEAWVQPRLLEILKGKSWLVAAAMRRSATRRDLAPEVRKQVDTCANYIHKLKPYLRYDVFLAQGFPIATGVIEGACRHLVKDRMDLTGARWSLTGAEAILRLRALKSSGDFDEYWRFHEAQEFKRNHAARYKDGIVPEVVLPNPLGRSRFRVVK